MGSVAYPSRPSSPRPRRPIHPSLSSSPSHDRVSSGRESLRIETATEQAASPAVQFPPPAPGMDPRYHVTRDELYNVQMDLKHVQATQSNHAERLLRLERRQQEDAAVKSVWSSPIPAALRGTPQHGERSTGGPFGGYETPRSQRELTFPCPGPIHLPPQGPFDLDDQNHTIASLHLEPDAEPARRGAASRANSVRFDES